MTVLSMPGILNPEGLSTPNPELIQLLTNALNMAQTGQLQSFIGTGFTNDGLRLASWCDRHDNIYEMLGSIEWLKQEYIERHPAE